ncbi:MAG: hypothetical protein GX334_01995 [Firmicutes bacterium]|nr:hypothetical protein [Bacillota bacterium]
MINKIPVADRAVLEQGLKRLKLRHTREIVDAAHELAMEEEPGYIDFLAQGHGDGSFVPLCK